MKVSVLRLSSRGQHFTSLSLASCFTLTSLMRNEEERGAGRRKEEDEELGGGRRSCVIL